MFSVKWIVSFLPFCFIFFTPLASSLDSSQSSEWVTGQHCPMLCKSPERVILVILMCLEAQQFLFKYNSEKSIVLIHLYGG